MLRRSILQLSSCRAHGRIPIQVTTQMPSYLASRRALSAAPHSNEPKGPSAHEAAKSGSSFPFILGGVVLGTATMVAYRTGYFEKIFGEKPQSTLEGAKVPASEQNQHDLNTIKSSPEDSESVADSRDQDNYVSTSDMELSEKDSVGSSDSSTQEDLSSKQKESQHLMNDNSELKPEELNHAPEDHLSSSFESSNHSDVASDDVRKSPKENLGLKKPEFIDHDQLKAVETTPSLQAESTADPDNGKISMPVPHPSTPDSLRDDLGDSSKQPASLLGEYLLGSDGEEAAQISSKSEDSQGIKEGSYVSGDGKLVLDFLQAIHAAEERRAELDAQAYAEEKRALKAKYEKELRDARARELMYAEREAILEKELNKEKVRSAAALKALEEEMEEKLKEELENKANEAELELKKVQELAKAELASAVAREKASQIEKMAEANLHINALCMAFYARSEEARQSHSVHKLALGALALEDALSKGLPIQKEIEALSTYLEGVDKDSLLDLVLFSLPEETRSNGTDTLLQLNQKFNALKGTIRHFSYIPQGGGGILSHSLASVASTLKVNEDDQSGDGIESLMNKVKNLLAQGKLGEAADVLENGVKGTQAAEVVTAWVTQARNRAITEQALTLLQSYATSISLT